MEACRGTKQRFNQHCRQQQYPSALNATKDTSNIKQYKALLSPSRTPKASPQPPTPTPVAVAVAVATSKQFSSQYERCVCSLYLHHYHLATAATPWDCKPGSPPAYLKCVSALGSPVGFPECPACLCDSFSTAKCTGSNAYVSFLYCTVGEPFVTFANTCANTWATVTALYQLCGNATACQSMSHTIG